MNIASNPNVPVSDDMLLWFHGVHASGNVSPFDSTAVIDRMQKKRIEQMIQTENFDNFVVCIENAVIEAVFLIKKNYFCR